jgi:hypothetical protein
MSNPHSEGGAQAKMLAGFVASTSRQGISQLADQWRAEITEYSPVPTDFEAAACAELAPELEEFADLIDEDDDEFVKEWCEWYFFIWDHELWLPLEQSCSEGVLLPMDQRALRLRTCPEQLLRHLRWFFELCPAHIKHHLALHIYVEVRVERYRRLKTPDWRPNKVHSPVPSARVSCI